MHFATPVLCLRRQRELRGNRVVAASERDASEVRIRPRESLKWSAILIFIIVPIPIFATLFILGLPKGSWPIPLAAAGIAVVLFAIGFYLFQTTYVAVSRDHFTERGFFRRPIITPIAEVRSTVLVRISSASSVETLPQLIVRDAQGRRILRLRGVFWTEESIRAVAVALGTPLVEAEDPMTSKQFFEQYAGSAYWFENRRGLAIGVIALAGLACMGLVLGLMGILQLPFRA